MVLALPEEFFEGWEWNDGDQVYLTEEIDEYSCSDEHGLYTVFDDLVCNAGFTCTEDWLYVRAIDFKNERPIPSQGQLQEKCMALINCDAHDLLRFFEAWIYEDEIRPVVSFADFNDLWLKYTIWVWGRKEWNGDAWI